MVENIQNSFEGYIGLFTFYIILINYTIFMDKILIFEVNWVQNTIVPYLYMTIKIPYSIKYNYLLRNESILMNPTKTSFIHCFRSYH